MHCITKWDHEILLYHTASHRFWQDHNIEHTTLFVTHRCRAWRHIIIQWSTTHSLVRLCAYHYHAYVPDCFTTVIRMKRTPHYHDLFVFLCFDRENYLTKIMTTFCFIIIFVSCITHRLFWSKPWLLLPRTDISFSF